MYYPYYMIHISIRDMMYISSLSNIIGFFTLKLQNKR